jgi:hypothetical protein
MIGMVGILGQGIRSLALLGNRQKLPGFSPVGDQVAGSSEVSPLVQQIVSQIATENEDIEAAVSTVQIIVQRRGGLAKFDWRHTRPQSEVFGLGIQDLDITERIMMAFQLASEKLLNDRIPDEFETTSWHQLAQQTISNALHEMGVPRSQWHRYITIYLKVLQQVLSSETPHRIDSPDKISL